MSWMERKKGQENDDGGGVFIDVRLCLLRPQCLADAGKRLCSRGIVRSQHKAG